MNAPQHHADSEATQASSPSAKRMEASNSVKVHVNNVREMTKAEFINRLCPNSPVFSDDVKEKAKMMGELPAMNAEQKAAHLERVAQEFVDDVHTGFTIHQESKQANECVDMVMNPDKHFRKAA
jgi:hypothetical protein